MTPTTTPAGGPTGSAGPGMTKTGVDARADLLQARGKLEPGQIVTILPKHMAPRGVPDWLCGKTGVCVKWGTEGAWILKIDGARVEVPDDGLI